MHEPFTDEHAVHTLIIKFRTVKLSLVLPVRKGVTVRQKRI